VPESACLGQVGLRSQGDPGNGESALGQAGAGNVRILYMFLTFQVLGQLASAAMLAQQRDAAICSRSAATLQTADRFFALLPMTGLY
jgi:hypothetical protein